MTLKPTNRLIGSKSDKTQGWKPRPRRDKNSRRGKSSTIAVKAFDSIEAAIGGRDAVVGALAAADLTEDQSYLFGLIADPRNDARSLASICAKANYTLGHLLQLFKEAKLARAQIEAIVQVAEGLPTIAGDLVTLAKIQEEPCQTCDGTGKAVLGDGEVLEDPCIVCNGTGKHTHVPTVERQKLALEIGGLYHRGTGVQIANVFSPTTSNELGGRITPDYLKDMRMGTDRLLYPGRSAGVDTSEAVDAEIVENAKSEVAENLTLPTERETKSESGTKTGAALAPVPSGDKGLPFYTPTGTRPKEPA